MVDYPLNKPGELRRVSGPATELFDPETQLRRSRYNAVRDAWLMDLRAADKSSATQGVYRRALDSFFAYCVTNSILLGDVTRGAICEWRDRSLARYNASTIKLRLAAIRSFYDFLIENQQLTTNPAARVRCIAASGQQSIRRDELTDSEMRALLRSCDRFKDSHAAAARDRAILYLMAYAGLRTIEVNRAERGDLGMLDGRLVLWTQRKGHRQPDGYIVIPGPAEQPLRDWLDQHPGGGLGPLFVSVARRSYGGRLSANYIRRMVKNRLRSCGINAPTKSTHSLRHSAINRARRGGATIEAIQGMTGHRRIESVMNYLHQQGRTSNPAEDRIDYGTDEET